MNYLLTALNRFIFLPVFFTCFIFSGRAFSQSCNNWLGTPSTGSFVTIGDLDITGNKLTVEAVFNRASALGNGVNFGKLVSKHTDQTNVNYSLMPLQCEITTDVTGYVATPQVCLPTLDKTYHVAMVYDGATLKFYRDGYLLTETPCTGNLVNNNLLTTIGQLAGPAHPLNMQHLGYINEVRIWNTARTQAELRANMHIALPAPVQPGLVGYYSFNNLLNKQGTVAFNGTLNGQAQINQTNTNCAFAPDSCGVVLSPSCSNWLNTPSQPSWVNIGDVDVPGTQLTVEALINIKGVPPGGVIQGLDVVSKHTGPANVNYLLRSSHAELSTSNGFFYTPDGCPLEMNKTYHVAMVYNGISLKYYRNGFLTGETPATGNMIQNNLPTGIGFISTLLQAENFIGFINEVRIWNVARSQTQIRNNMNVSLTNPTTQPGLLAYYTFDNLLNKQGNPAWNGTLVGSAAINKTNPECLLTAVNCPALTNVEAAFTAPDTVCVNSPVNITNISLNATSHYWNFCTGDINKTPEGTNLGNFGGLLQMPVFMDYVFYNGNYYGFLINHDPGKLIRFNFGNSLLNVPTTTDLGNFGGLIPRLSEGIQVVQNEGRWYAIIVAGYTANGVTPRILKVDFGPVLTNTVPVVTNWGNLGNMEQPIDLHVFQENGNWFGLTVNAENNTITRFNFTNSFNNTPTAVNLGNIGGLTYPNGLYAINDNNSWKVFITNGGNAFRTNGVWSLTRLDFGNSLLNTPIGVNLGNPGGILKHPSDLTIIKSCGEIIGFAVNGAIGANEVIKLDFNNDLNSVPTMTSLGNTGNLNFPVGITKIFRQGPDLFSFVCNAANNTLTRLRFAGCTNSSIPNSVSPNPPPITYSTPGIYNINLTIDDGLPTQSSVCKQVYVKDCTVPIIPDFDIPDTVCVNTSFSITNNTVGATSHYWNFCSGDLNKTPTGINLGNPGGLLSQPVFMDYVFYNGNYYGFLINHYPGKLVRLNFGNSLLNTPTAVDLGNFGGIIHAGYGSEGIQIVQNEGRWYAIIVGGYPPPVSPPRVIKIDFGPDLLNINPVATNWGDVGNLSQPIDLHVFKEGNNWYGFTVNAENNTITRFNFTNSFNNTPTAINLGGFGLLNYPTGIYAINDNGNWRVFITSHGSGSKLVRLDFGNSLLNTPTAVDLGSIGGTDGTRDFTIIKDCDQMTGFAVMQGTNTIWRLNFATPTSVPVATNLGNIGNLNFPHSISKIFRVNDDLYTFITNVTNNTITRLRFAGCSNSNPANSALQNPPPIIYNTPGTYNINLTIDDGLPTQSSVCKQVVVKDCADSTIINDYTPILSFDPCKNSLRVEDASKFKVGDTVLMIQMKGAVIDSTNTAAFGTITNYRNAGNYEFNYVKAKTGNVIELLNVVQRQYDIPVGKVQLIRVPYFQDYSTTSTLTCLPWDGRKGGVLVFNVQNTLTLNRDVTVGGRGFRGGNDPYSNPASFYCYENQYFYPNNPDLASEKGEGISDISVARSFGKGALANGGGGGNSHNSGGGGGGNGNTGGFGGYNYESAPCNTNVPFDNRGIGGKTLLYSNAANKIFMGGGGGAGQTNNPEQFKANGGNGGGIVIITAGTINTNNRAINAGGNSAIECSGLGVSGCHEGMGGGGAGGVIVLNVNAYTGNLNANTTGGKGGDMTVPAYGRLGPGGGGGGGVAWIKSAVKPANLLTNNAGGINGVNTGFSNDSWGATAGNTGSVLTGLQLPVTNTPFKANIDSVRIKMTTTGCNSYSFEGLAYTNTNPISSWQWFFGDGNTASTQNTTHTYFSEGIFTVKLIVTDINGCKDSITTDHLMGNCDVVVDPPDTTACGGFQIAMGGQAYDRAFDVAATTNNEFYVAGISRSFSSSDDILVTRLTAGGTIIWSKTFGNTGQEIVRKITPTADGGLLVVGQTKSFTNNQGDILCMKIAANGNLLWSKVLGLGSANGDLGMDIIETTDGGYAVSGIINVNGTVADAVVTKLNNLGNVTWSKRFDRGDGENGVGILQKQDTLIIGIDLQNTTLNYELVLMKLKLADGAFIMSKKITPDTRGLFNSYVLKDPLQPGYIISAHTIENSSYADMKHTVLRVDDDFNVRKSQLFSFNPATNDFYTGLAVLPDGSVIGTASSLTNTDGYIYRINEDNSGVFIKKFYSPLYRVAVSGQQLMAVGGVTRVGQEDFLVTSFDINGALGAACNTEDVSLILQQSGYSVSSFTWPNISNVNFPVSAAVLNTTTPPIFLNELCPSQKPDFTFKRDPCAPKTIQFFTNLTGIESYEWDFGDGHQSTGNPNPVNTYADFGDYIVKLRIRMTGGCLDSLQKLIRVDLLPDNLILTNDTIICHGSTKQLQTIPSLSVCWSPVTYLDNPNSPNPTTSATQDITYYFTAEVTGTNLVTNGDFSSGNSGFTSEFIFDNSSAAPGRYFIGTNPVTWFNGASNCVDHTGGNGNMMAVAPGNTPGRGIWKQTVTVTPNTNYVFSVWMQTLTNSDAAQLQLSINGNEVGSLIKTSLPSCNWIQTYINWNSGNNTIAELSLRDERTRIMGNLFAVDDISFAPVFMKRDSVKIKVEKPLVTASADTIICAGTPAQLNATGGQTYIWSPATGLSSPGIPNPVASPIVSTEYIVTGTSVNGCSAKDTVNVNVFTKATINVTNDTLVCKNAQVQLSATGGSTYSWTPAATLNNPLSPNPVASPLSNTKYYVDIRDAHTCVYRDSVEVTTRPDAVFGVNDPSSVCRLDSAQLNASGGDTYVWTPAGGLSSSNISNPKASPVVTTDYSVTITESVCHQSATLIARVTVMPLPTVNAVKSNDIDCRNDRSQLTASGAAQYTWTPAASLSNAAIHNPVATPASATQYIVTGRDINGCSAKDTIDVNVFAKPTITISNDTTICKNAQAQLNVTGGETYSWSPAATLSNPFVGNPLASPVSNTKYYVLIKDAINCEYLDSIEVSIRPDAVFTINAAGAVCKDGSIQLNAGGGDSYSWLPAAGLNNAGIANPIASPTTTTDYAVTITENTCHQTQTLTTRVTIKPALTINATKSNDIDCSHDRSVLIATGANQYVWTPATTLSDPSVSNPIATPSTTTEYIVEGTDGSGCKGYDTITVKVDNINKGGYLMPSAFTPNNDGLNDCYGVKYWGVIQELEFSVYNRWGERIFFTKNPGQCWDGTYKGAKQDIGVYVYMVKAKTTCENEVFRKGTFVLVR